MKTKMSIFLIALGLVGFLALQTPTNVGAQGVELGDGVVVTAKVDKSVKAFDTLKVGDSIHARYTEAIAISVEKP